MCGAAGRWDLHHAILYHGGYLAVAKLLQRRSPQRGRPMERPPLTTKEVAAELRAFQNGAGSPPGVLPSARALIEAGRPDLLQVGFLASSEVDGSDIMDACWACPTSNWLPSLFYLHRPGNFVEVHIDHAISRTQRSV